MLRTLPALAAAALLGFLHAPVLAQSVYVSPPSGPVDVTTLEVAITWTHDSDLSSGTRTIQVTGPNGAVNVSWTYEAAYTDPNTGGVLMAQSVGQVPIAAGTTSVQATLCFSGLPCGSDAAEYTYVPPPPPADRAEPTLSLAPHSNWVQGASVGSTLSYSTPPYMSLDQPRSVALVYFSEHAAPQGFVQVDVTDPSLIPAEAFSITVLDTAGDKMTLSNGQTSAYYGNQGGTTGGVSRLGAQFSAASLGSGAHTVTIEVTSHWPGVTRVRTVQAVVLVVNRVASKFGAGWTIAGLKRVYPDAGGVMVDEADGSARYFRNVNGVFTASPDDPSTLVYDAASQRYNRRWPNGSGETYASSGNLLHAFTHFGDTVRYVYNTAGDRPVSIVDPAGLTTTLAYHSGGHPQYDNLANITTPGGRTSHFGYWDGWTNLTAVQEPDGSAALRIVYENPAKRLSSWIDATGGQWNVAYDHVGAVASLTAPTITVAGQSARPVTETAAARRALLPASGEATSSSPKPRVVPSSLSSKVTGPRGDVTTVVSDRYGLPLSVSGPLGHSVTVERDTAGRPRVVSDASGMETHVGWDGDGHVESSFVQSSGTQSTTDYETFSGARLLTRVVAAGQETRYARGTRGEVLAVVVQGDTMVWYTYDSRYRVLTTRYRDNRVVRNFYDGTAWKNTDSVRVESTSGPQTSAFTYDAYGRGRTVRDPNGRVTTRSLDVFGRLLKQVAPGDSVRFAYDSVGLWRVTDAAGKVFEFRRNRLGWVQQEVDPNGRITSMGYDLAGNVVSYTDRFGRTFSRAYDLLGRTTSATAPGIPSTTYKYDNPNGSYFVVANSESRDSVAYNPAGQVVSTVTTIGSLTLRVGNDYGSTGLHESRTVASPAVGTAAWSTTVGYLYDSRQRLAWITDSPGNTSTGVAYDVPGRVQKLTYPGTIGTLTLGYDARSQVSYNSYSNGSLQGTFGASLTYDLLGRRTGRTGQSGYRKRVHSYDGPARMTGYSDERWTYFPPVLCDQEFPDGSCEGHYAWQSVGSGNYGYDAVGNRTSWSVTDSLGTTTSSGATLQPTSNRYASFDGWTLTYDSIGNLVRRQRGSEEVRYEWNSLGQLRSVWTPASGSVYYGYNGFGLRVARKHGTVVTRYLYDERSNLVAELDGMGNPLRTYTHLGLDQPHSMRTWSGTTPGAVHYYALDLPGNNVNGLFNGSGSVTHKYSYTPWGQAQSTSEATYNPLRYASRELDPASGLYYNRARWYDPYLGRFISEDPIGIDGGINVYAYAGNDPVNFTDPMGLTCVGQIYTSQTTCKLAPISIRAPGWMRRAWDAAQGNRRWGGLSEGRGPTSIFGDGVERVNAQDDMDLVDELVDAAPEEGDRRTCGQAISSALLSLGLDGLTVIPVFAAYRGWRAAQSIPELLQAGKLLGRAGHDAAVRNAQAEFRRTAASGATGAVLGAAQTHSEGANWRYAVPILGTGERIGDAAITCLIKDWWLYD